MSVKAHAYNCPKDGSVVTCVGNDENADYDGTLTGVCPHCGTAYQVQVVAPADGNARGNTYAAPVGHTFGKPGGTDNAAGELGLDEAVEKVLVKDLNDIVNAAAKLREDDRAGLLDMINRRVAQYGTPEDDDGPLDEDEHDPPDTAYAAWRQRVLKERAGSAAV